MAFRLLLLFIYPLIVAIVALILLIHNLKKIKSKQRA
jgi:hypothetical protein